MAQGDDAVRFSSSYLKLPVLKHLYKTVCVYVCVMSVCVSVYDLSVSRDS